MQSASSIRVLGVDPELKFAGGESQVLALTLELGRMGHRAELACDPRGELWKRATAHDVMCRRLAIRNSIDVGAALRLRRILAEENFDVVHFHTSRAHALAPLARANVEALVVTRRMDYAPNRLFAPFLYNRAVDAVAAISSGVADALEGSGVERARIRIIPSGVDCQAFKPAMVDERAAARSALGLKDSDVAIGSIGALEIRKGHVYLAEAARILGREDVRIFIAGEGSARAQLESKIKSLGLAEKVTLMGSVSEPGRRVLRALDIFVLASINEGLGVSLLEAMATGLPVIGSRVGGIVDAIEEGRSGLMTRAGDAAGLASALGRLIENPALRQQMGAAGRSRALEHFSVETMARRTLEMYQNTIENRRGRSGTRCAA